MLWKNDAQFSSVFCMRASAVKNHIVIVWRIGQMIDSHQQFVGWLLISYQSMDWFAGKSTGHHALDFMKDRGFISFLPWSNSMPRGTMPRADPALRSRHGVRSGGFSGLVNRIGPMERSSRGWMKFVCNAYDWSYEYGHIPSYSVGSAPSSRR